MLRIALVVSGALHVALGMWVEVRHLAAPDARVVVDSWTGPGIEIDTVVADGAAVSLARPSEPPESPAVPGAARSDGAASPADPVHVTTAEQPRVQPVSRVSRLARPAARTEHAVAEPSVPSVPSSAGGATLTASGAFGAVGLPAGVRHLPKAFARALGLASRGDPRWLALPVGPVGQARFHLAVDEEGRLGELEYDEPDARDHVPPVVQHLLENTRLLLLAGRFSLDPAREKAGTQALRVRVELSEAAPAGDPASDPNGLSELEYEAPSVGKPGRGSFRLNSGRRVTGWVYLE